MAQQTGPITLNDGAATPVARTFALEQVSNGLATFIEKTAGVSAGFIRMSISWSPASGSRPTNRSRVAFSYPVLSTVNGISTVAYTLRYQNGDFIIPDVATALERAHLHAFVANAMASAQVKALVKDLDPIY